MEFYQVNIHFLSKIFHIQYLIYIFNILDFLFLTAGIEKEDRYFGWWKRKENSLFCWWNRKESSLLWCWNWKELFFFDAWTEKKARFLFAIIYKKAFFGCWDRKESSLFFDGIEKEAHFCFFDAWIEKKARSLVAGIEKKTCFFLDAQIEKKARFFDADWNGKASTLFGCWSRKKDGRESNTLVSNRMQSDKQDFLYDPRPGK